MESQKRKDGRNQYPRLIAEPTEINKIEKGVIKIRISTHVTIALILYGHFKKKMKLDKTSFIYGNIKPDLSYKLIKKAHIMENHFRNVCESSKALMEKPMDREKFSVELGQICHYVSDFFCKYHLNREVFHKFGGHFLHEVRLQFLLWKLLIKEKLLLINKKERRNIASILLEMRSNYDVESSAPEKDLTYAISTALWIGESVAYFLNQPAESVMEREAETEMETAMEMYAMAFMTGGK